MEDLAQVEKKSSASHTLKSLLLFVFFLALIGSAIYSVKDINFAEIFAGGSSAVDLPPVDSDPKGDFSRLTIDSSLEIPVPVDFYKKIVAVEVLESLNANNPSLLNLEVFFEDGSQVELVNMRPLVNVRTKLSDGTLSESSSEESILEFLSLGSDVFMELKASAGAVYFYKQSEGFVYAVFLQAYQIDTDSINFVNK